MVTDLSEEKTEKKEPTEFTEAELLEIHQFLEEKRKTLNKHPESKDYTALWGYQQYIVRRMQEIAWQQYAKAKGIEALRV